MKNLTKLLKTLALCIVLVMMGGWAKGAVITVGTVTLTPAGVSSVTYGTSTPLTYRISIPFSGSSGTVSLSFSVSGNPANSIVTGTTTTTINNKSVSPIVLLFTIDNYNSTNSKYAAANNYTLTVTNTNPSISASSAYNITQCPLAVTGTSATISKTYDGNKNVTITGLVASGIVAADNVTLDGTFASKNAANGISISGVTLSPAFTTNYTLSSCSPLSGTITAKPLTVSGATVTSKVYDGTTAATISGSLPGVISGDAVTLIGTGTFASATVGTKAVTSTSTLSGLQAGNYSLTQPTGLTGNITPLALTISGATVNSKVYDGTTAATITGTLTGVISPDAVTLNRAGTFASVNVGTGISVTSTSTISGLQAGNYTLTQPTGLTGTITAPTAVSWNGTSTDWANASNWTPPYLPDATIDVTIPNVTNKPSINASTAAVCNNLTINASSGITIQPQGSLTVSTNLTNNAAASGLSLLSDATGTGSLIVNGSASGAATLTRSMTDGVFHLVTSPLGGQSIINFLGDPVNATTILQGTAANDATYRGMSEYNPTANNWNDYFKTNSAGDVTPGKGYSIRVRKTISPKAVVFKGTLPTGDITLSGLTGGYWNCIGNPYTSAITINSTGAATTRFLENNSSNLDPAFVSVYVWDPAVSQTAYTSVSNATTPTYNLQQGQAFMVKMASGKSSVSFLKTMQVHNVSLALKSTDDIWSTINLTATADSINSSTTIAFHDGMTNGLDVSYDAGLLKAGSPIDLYTRLVDDYGIPFAIQALPSDAYDQLIIPVGVDYTKGGEVSFSAKGMYLPSSCRPLLEDRLTGIITDLSDKTYTTDLTANTAGTGRFYLHTSYSTTGAANSDKASQLSAWAVGNTEIIINGKINKGAVASLYDLQGRLIVTHVMREGIRGLISLPAVNSGIYLLQVRDAQTVQALKVTVGQ